MVIGTTSEVGRTQTEYSKDNSSPTLYLSKVESGAKITHPYRAERRYATASGTSLCTSSSRAWHSISQNPLSNFLALVSLLVQNKAHIDRQWMSIISALHVGWHSRNCRILKSLNPSFYISGAFFVLLIILRVNSQLGSLKCVIREWHVQQLAFTIQIRNIPIIERQS